MVFPGVFPRVWGFPRVSVGFLESVGTCMSFCLSSPKQGSLCNKPQESFLLIIEEK